MFTHDHELRLAARDLGQNGGNRLSAHQMCVQPAAVAIAVTTR
jgi:hypothetical protein